MPSPRKRIGFLPSHEVQQIIDEICKYNKLSQSKVTGTLVEEALNSRGIIAMPEIDLSFDFYDNKEKSNSLVNDCNNFPSKNSRSKDIEMINEFIEFKFFKKIMIQNKSDY